MRNQLIQGRYRLLEQIGRGGMGAVWRAHDEALGREVAVKCHDPMGSGQDESVLEVLRERFRREARVAASLQHRGVTVVHDFGADDGVLFLVMELLDGHNLAELISRGGRRPLSVPEVMDIAAQVSAALAYTHRRGIVHRDLKPANVMRLHDGTVKICDFGIARPGEGAADASAKLTGVGIALGTPHYMSPEQIGGSGPVDHRSDLYSLGCVLYEIATGSPPFDLEDTWSILIAHRDTEPVPPRSHRPELPEVFDDVVLRLLAKDPDDRPQDAAEVAALLAPGPPTAYGHPALPPAPTTTSPSAWAGAVKPGPVARRRPGTGPGPVAPPEGLTRVWTHSPVPAGGRGRRWLRPGRRSA